MTGSRARALIVAIVACKPIFAGMDCNVTVAISPDIKRVTSIAKARYLTFDTQDNSVIMKIHERYLHR